MYELRCNHTAVPQLVFSIRVLQVALQALDL
eukprot:SAG22_NODE_18506_length_286_cov_0.823529_1_plen_30_part_10